MKAYIGQFQLVIYPIEIIRNNNFINFVLACSNRDLRSCYYHIAKTTKDALYKISSCYPITEKYIDHEFISNGKHVIMRKQDDINEIRRKFKRILSMEFRNPNYFPQHITDIRNYLVEELNKCNDEKNKDVAK